MKQVWSEENKYEKWLEVETPFVKWAPWASFPKAPCQDKAGRLNINRMNEIFKNPSRCDAFLSCLRKRLGQGPGYTSVVG
jgi:adenylosuccinate lyase